MYINQFDIYINGNFFVSGYLFYKFVRSLYNEKRRKEERNKKCCMKQESKVGYRDIFRQTEYMKIMIAALINLSEIPLTQLHLHGSSMRSQEMPRGRQSFMV